MAPSASFIPGPQSPSLPAVLGVAWQWKCPSSVRVAQAAPVVPSPCLLTPGGSSTPLECSWLWSPHGHTMQAGMGLCSSTVKNKITFHLSALPHLPHQTPHPRTLFKSFQSNISLKHCSYQSLSGCFVQDYWQPHIQKHEPGLQEFRLFP